MTDDRSLYWYWLTNIKGIGRHTIGNLIDEFETPDNIYYEDNNVIIKFLRENKCWIKEEEYINSKRKEDIIYSYRRLLNNNIRFLHRDSAGFPERLKIIPDAPFGLYLKGTLPDDEGCFVAVIGARNCTHYGREMARVFGRELSKAGVYVVSGLARGIDGMAHRGALEGGGNTVGVLGCGIDVVYPEENYELFIRMLEKGAIISESNMGVKPAAGLFPQRNRLISGMCDGILVIEATQKSGTFITVDQGLEQGKDIFALPGRLIDECSRGCNNLIKMGAHLVTDVNDILEILGGKCSESYDYESHDLLKISLHDKNLLAPMEKIVYSVLSVEPKYIDDIIFHTRLAPGEVCKNINRMVISGIIEEPIRNYYSIKL